MVTPYCDSTFLCSLGILPVTALILFSALHRVKEGSLVVYIKYLENGQVVNSVIVFGPHSISVEKKKPQET